VNALQEGQALHQPANAVMDSEPRLVGRGMTVSAPPATYRFLEGWGEAAFAAAPSIGSRIGGHGRILIPGRRRSSSPGANRVAMMEDNILDSPDRAGGWRGANERPFPATPHRTVRAVLPHTALRRASRGRMRTRRIANGSGQAIDASKAAFGAGPSLFRLWSRGRPRYQCGAQYSSARHEPSSANVAQRGVRSLRKLAWGAKHVIAR
jgi:hypothetical protein